MSREILKNLRFKNIIRGSLFVFILVIFISVPLYQAKADFLGIGNIASSAVITVVGTISLVIKAILASMIGALGTGTTYVMKMPIGDSGVVQNAWELVRNFANMLFILVLIIMAFGTIFSVSSYDFRQLIARFLIAAVIINFSLVIGNTVIDWGQALNNVFLDSIGDVGARIGQGADLGARFQEAKSLSSSSAAPSADSTVWQEVITSFGDVAMLGIILFSMLVLFVTTLARIPIIWGLLIVSPIAWITYVLPSTRNVSRLWWKYFLGWNFFMPIYLFFIYIGVMFLSNKDQILSGNNTVGFGGINFEDLFFYLLIGFFLIGGAKVALNSSMSAGARSVAMGVRGRTWAMSKAVGYAPAGLARYGWERSGASQVYKEGSKTFREEGLAGFKMFEGTALGRLSRGQRGQDEGSARLGQITGVAPGLADKQLGKNIDIETRKLRERGTSQNRVALEDLMKNGNREQKIASASLLREFHRELSADEVLEISKEYGGETLLSNKFLAGINYKKYSPEDIQKLYDEIPNIQLKEKLTEIMFEKNMVAPEDFSKHMAIFTSEGDAIDAIKKSKDLRDKLNKQARLDLYSSFKGSPYEKGIQRELSTLMVEKGDFDESGLRSALSLFETSADKVRFLDSAKKKNMIEAIRLLRENNLLKDKDGNEIATGNLDDDIMRAVQEEKARMNVNKLMDLSNDTLKDPMFQAGMQSFITADKIDQITKHAEFNQVKEKALEDMFETARWQSFFADKIVPLNNRIDRIKNYLDQATKSTDMEAKRLAVRDADAQVKEAIKSLRSLEEFKFVDPASKDRLEDIVKNRQGELRAIETQIKTILK